ncbi:hypothetical protein GEV27_04495 [Aeromicrobium sp. S22]|uniref:divisome protein SepX/GlpR n=1 Tax=Aeromicrobium sp. S22 TaxID=2662029 RepID=UPI00129DA699|nr:hypothetical protein [Aeromicrobium sp. S22]MRK00775.1 hypothetical protein [Aeromicrobium sp. S22]
MGPSSGLIIAFVVVVWAAYFIPLALRRYDDATKNESVETTGTLSRVVTKPSAATQAAAPAAPAASVRAPAAPKRDLDRPAARLAARRRRRTLLTLLGLTAVVTVLAVTGVLPTLAIAAPVALVAAWLVACRIQVRGELGIVREKKPRTGVATSDAAPSARTKSKTAAKVTPRLSPDEEETVIVSGLFEDIDPGRKHEMEVVDLEADALDDQIVIAVPSVSSSGEALWDPLPVTLPTYVTKPRAGRTVRTIDFSQPNTWTSGHIEGEEVELPKRADDTGEERRAVGH